MTLVDAISRDFAPSGQRLIFKPRGCGREIFRDGARPRGAAARTHARSFDPGLSRTHMEPLVVMSTVVFHAARRRASRARRRQGPRLRPSRRSGSSRRRDRGRARQLRARRGRARVAVAALASVVVALPAVRVLPPARPTTRRDRARFASRTPARAERSRSSNARASVHYARALALSVGVPPLSARALRLAPRTLETTPLTVPRPLAPASPARPQTAAPASPRSRSPRMSRSRLRKRMSPSTAHRGWRARPKPAATPARPAGRRVEQDQEEERHRRLQARAQGVSPPRPRPGGGRAPAASAA